MKGQDFDGLELDDLLPSDFDSEEVCNLLLSDFNSQQTSNSLSSGFNGHQTSNFFPYNNIFVQPPVNQLIENVTQDNFNVLQDPKSIFIYKDSPSTMFSSTILINRSFITPTNYVIEDPNSNYHIPSIKDDLCPSGLWLNLDKVLNITNDDDMDTSDNDNMNTLDKNNMDTLDNDNMDTLDNDNMGTLDNDNKDTLDNSISIPKENSNDNSPTLPSDQRKRLLDFFVTKDSTGLSPEEYDVYYKLNLARESINHSFKNMSSTKISQEMSQVMKLYNENFEKLLGFSKQSPKESETSCSFETSPIRENINTDIGLESKNFKNFLSEPQQRKLGNEEENKFVALSNGSKKRKSSPWSVNFDSVKVNSNKSVEEYETISNESLEEYEKSSTESFEEYEETSNESSEEYEKDSNESFKDVQIATAEKLKFKIENIEEENEEDAKSIYEKAQIAYENKNYYEALELCKSITFPKNLHLVMQDIWDRSHEMIESKKRGHKLNSVQRFRLKQRFEYPETIWDGDRVKYGMSQKKKKMLILFYDQFSKNPNTEERAKLAEIIDVPSEKVAVFFKNRRCRSGDTRTPGEKSNQPKSKKIDWNRFEHIKNELWMNE